MPKKRPTDNRDDLAKPSSDFKRHISTYAAPTTTATAAKEPVMEAVIKLEELDDTDPCITKNTLMWFRNDLRLQDNTALHAASIRAKVGNTSLVGLYILSPEEWLEHDEAPVKIDFWMRNLQYLQQSLEDLAIPLVVQTAAHKEEVPGVVLSVVDEMEISHVFWNSELLVDERKRDKAVRRLLLSTRPNVSVEESDDQCIVPPADVRTKVEKATNRRSVCENRGCPFGKDIWLLTC